MLPRNTRQLQTLWKELDALRYYKTSTLSQHHVRSLVHGSTCCTNMKDVNIPLAQAYKPSEVEQGWYPWWESQGFFRKCGSPKKFVMVLPPPNVTGTLHLGHALTCAVQDAIARWQQMCGHDVVWVPGCDHAGIATQVVVEKYLLAKEGITKHILGRDRFVEEVWKWKNEKGPIIYDQMKRLGASLDWQRAVFTMDEHMSEAVTEAFILLYDSGLVSHKKSLVNWCCSLQSTISDIEVEHLHLTGPTELQVPGYEEPVMFGQMYEFAYKVVGTGEEVVVCTTRPETMLGDTAVMVHPDDQRYTHLHGCHLLHPLRNQSIPLITDCQVDPHFGTGAVKVTPAHDTNDYSVGQRHGLPHLEVFDERGRMTDLVPQFQHLRRFEAREEILEALGELGLYRGCRPHTMMVPVCSRTSDIIEPMLRSQWFVSCKEMAEEAMSAVRTGELKIVPEHYNHLWYEWLADTDQWCISRQLWWGHRIPVYCISTKTQEFWTAARSKDDAKQRIVKKEGISESSILSIQQDEDVLDTWFSSALFPFAVFGWPTGSQDFTTNYPTTLIETGHDILFFWVARMVMLGQKLTGKLPFNTVLLHGLLCDAHGHKMSKSRGNIINPLDVIDGATLQDLNERLREGERAGILTEKEAAEAIRNQEVNFPKGIPECGADALRFTLCSHNIKNQLLSVDATRMEQNKFLGNKIWQTVRFLESSVKKVVVAGSSLSRITAAQKDSLGIMDKWILSCLSALVCDANKHFETYDLHLLTAGFTSFWVNQLCDVYLESIKPILKSGSNEANRNCIQTLWTCVEVGLHILAPFMPHLTEELYHSLPAQSHRNQSIMECDYPLPKHWSVWRNEEVEKDVSSLLQVAAAFRGLRANYNIQFHNAKGSVVCTDQAPCELLREELSVVKVLGGMNSVIVTDGHSPPPEVSAVATVSETTSVYLHLEGAVDPEKELQRLRKKLGKLEKEEGKLGKRMSSPAFSEKASADTQEKLSNRLASLRSEIQQIKSLVQSIEKISGNHP